MSSALSIDAFAASFAYGSNKIKIPFLSAQIINLICTGILALSLLIGSLVKQLIPAWLTAVLCFALLFILGLDVYKRQPYMMIVVRNEAAKYIRSTEREVHSDIDHAANTVDAEEHLIMKEAFASLNAAAADLPNKYSDILYLKHVMKLDNKVISEILKITETNVRQRLCRARKMLKSRLKKGGDW